MSFRNLEKMKQDLQQKFSLPLINRFEICHVSFHFWQHSAMSSDIEIAQFEGTVYRTSKEWFPNQ